MSDNIFNEEAMIRPLFEELTAEHAREDGWSGPHGFAIGGMMKANEASLAEEYFAAANQLVEDIQEQRIADYRVAHAALFLYRHTCELVLKAALPASIRTHDLVSLTNAFVAWVKDQTGECVPAWIVSRMQELAAIDPNSTAFRYGAYGVAMGGNVSPNASEVYVSLAHLRAAMVALNTALVEAVGEIKLARG